MKRAITVLAVLLLAGCPDTELKKTGPGPGDAPVSTDTTSGPPAAARGWPGEYRSDKLTVTISAGSGGLDGTIKKGGKTFALKIFKFDGDVVVGAFEDQGASFDVKLERTGDDLALTTGNTTYELKRFVPPNPLDAPNPLDEPAKTPGKTPDAPSKPADVAGKKAVGGEDISTWQQFKTRAGHEVRYPRSWQVQTMSETVAALVPSDMVKDANGQPEEAIYLEVDSAGSFTSPDQPGAVQALTNRVTSTFFPYMRGTGSPQTFEVRGRKAVELSFAGTAPNGSAFEAKLFAVIINGNAMVAIAGGKADPLKKRLPTVRTIFGTYDSKMVVKTDPSMIGKWRHSRSHSSGDMTAVSEEYLWLKADGTCYWSSKFAGGGSAGTFEGSGSGQWEYTGRWSIEGRMLTMRWNSGGVEVKKVTRSGNSFMWKISKSTNKLWERYGQ